MPNESSTARRVALWNPNAPSHRKKVVLVLKSPPFPEVGERVRLEQPDGGELVYVVTRVEPAEVIAEVNFGK